MSHCHWLEGTLEKTTIRRLYRGEKRQKGKCVPGDPVGDGAGDGTDTLGLPPPPSILVRFRFFVAALAHLVIL